MQVKGATIQELSFLGIGTKKSQQLSTCIDDCRAVVRKNYSLVTPVKNRRKVTVISDIYFILVYFQMNYELLLYF